MIRVHASGHTAFPWRTDGPLRWRGLPPPAALLARLRDTDPARDDAVSRWVAVLSGVPPPFGAILETPHAILAGVDRARSFPLFHDPVGADFLLADDARAVLAQAADPGRDEDAVAEARVAGFVTGADTLHRAVKQVPAGHVLRAVPEGASVRLHGEPIPLPPAGPGIAPPPGDRAAALTSVLRGVASRLVASLAGRQAVIPLTGGYDSRLVALLLKDEGYARVLCVGFARDAHWETTVAREVARRLGFPWAHFGSEPGQWRAWYASAPFREFARSADGLCALPAVLEWPALHELRRNGAADEDAVIVPGTLGHFVTGTAATELPAPRRGSDPRSRLASWLARRRYAMNPWPRERSRAAAIRARLDASAEAAAAGAADLADAADRWEWREYQAKRAGGAVRAAEAGGFEWRLPFADPSLVEFFRALPLRDRAGCGLHHGLVDALGRRYDLPPANPGVGRGRRARRWLGRTGLIGPARILRRLARRLDGRGLSRGEGPGWVGILDPAAVRATFTGAETVESYLIRDWLEGVATTDLV